MSKENILLLHGFMGTGSSHFGPQISSLSEKYNVVPLTLPGHGDNSEEVKQPFFKTTLDWVAQKLKAQGESYIMGLSMGASIALHLALLYPELVKGVILTGYSPYIPENMKDIMKKQYEQMATIKYDNPILAKQYKVMHGERWFNTLITVLETFTFNYPSVTDSSLKKLKVPTLILNGSNEEHEREAVCYLSHVNPIITAGIIPNCGHVANLENSDLYNQMVLNYLQNLHTA